MTTETETADTGEGVVLDSGDVTDEQFFNEALGSSAAAETSDGEDGSTAAEASADSGGDSAVLDDSDSADGSAASEEAESSADESSPVDELKAQIAELSAKLSEVEGKAGKESAEEDTAEQPDSADNWVDPAERLSEEEQNILKIFQEEHPEVRQAFDVQQRMFAERTVQLLSEQQDSMVNEFNRVLKPLIERVNSLSAESRETKVAGVFGDIRREDVQSWVQSQSTGVVRRAYEAALSSSKVEDVREVIEAFQAAKAESQPKQKPAIRKPSPIKTQKGAAPVLDADDETAAGPIDEEAIFKKATEKFKAAQSY